MRERSAEKSLANAIIRNKLRRRLSFLTGADVHPRCNWRTNLSIRRDHRAIDVGLRKVLPGVGIVDGKRQIRRSAHSRGARALYLYEGNKDTLYRIHGTNQPEYIGQAISSGCIRMTNEDVIDLFERVTPGATVVVLAAGQNTWMAPVAGRRS